ncbi:Six-hairpin glycosidase-like protein [Pilaira anomala]|nr:Six-hairpin glycosidase-like protein [Pilaira anomala]
MSKTTEQVYNQWKSKYLKSYKDGLYVYYRDNEDNSSAMTVSEAHGYGMLIAVLKKNQSDFEGLFRYFQSWKNSKGLMQWQQKKSSNGTFVPGDEGGKNSATDGDIDIATALFLAAKLWNNAKYRTAAESLAESLWEHCFNQSTYAPLLGDWATPDDSAYILTRPSDFILSGFLVFKNEDKQRQQIWTKVIDNLVKTFQDQLAINPQTGLVADFLTLDSNTKKYKPVTKKVLESNRDSDYNWNSCRVPWRLSHYYLQSGDQRLRPLLDAEANFFSTVLSKGSSIKAGYSLSGRPLVSYSDLAFTAPVKLLFKTLNLKAPLDQINKYIDQDNESGYFVGLVFATCSFLVDGTTAATDLLTITNPKANQPMLPGQQVIIQYTVHGSPKTIGTTTQKPNYPDSIDMILRWTDKKNQTIQFLALNGLSTDPYVDLVKDQVYDHRWKLPNCHFFRRYLPSDWTFSLIFQPQYHQETIIQPLVNNNRTHAPTVPLGPKQPDISIPISVQFNITAMEDPHHKGC